MRDVPLPVVITNLGSDAVCTLGHWVAVEGKFIIVFHKDIQRSVLAVPGVFDLRVSVGLGHVQQHLQPGPHLVLSITSPGLDCLVPGASWSFSVRVTDTPGYIASHLSSSLPQPLLATRVFLLLPISLCSRTRSTESLQ